VSEEYPLVKAERYADRAIVDVQRVRSIIHTVARGGEWSDDRQDEIRDLLGDAMGAVVAVAEALEIEL
jgi:hypothetical protein